MKTILVHLNDQRRAEALLAPVIAIARRRQSHVIGFHVYTGLPPIPTTTVPYGAELLDAVVAADKRDADALARIFANATAGSPFVAEWISEKSPYPDLAAFVMQRGRGADLIVASQSDPAWDMAPILDFPERLALESGRPVLIVPTFGQFRTTGRSVAVAWNGSRESARAAFDALPLLRDADSACIIVIGDARAADGSVLGAHDLAAAPARHGVHVTVREVSRDHGGIGETLLDAASAAGADLLVMGGYGHSRFRELVFGGVTRHVLRHMTIPTLLSH